jgi:hypothetical protein
MSRRQRKNVNRVNAPALARWIVITGFLALAGLCYVYLTLQLHRLGDGKKALENELVSLRQQNDVANVQIAALTSRSALQRRLKEGYLKMVPIAEQNIVRLAPMRPTPDEQISEGHALPRPQTRLASTNPASDENLIRPAANDRIGR